MVPGRTSSFPIYQQWEGFMSDQKETEPEVLERIPAMQRILDNPFLLLFFGVVIPAVIYLIWGIMELSQIPIAK
jgi:hypothetical protein